MINNANQHHQQLCFVFNDKNLLVTDKLEIPTENNPFIQTAQFKRSFSFTHDARDGLKPSPTKPNKSSFIAAELSPNIPLPANLQWKDLIELYFCLPEKIITLAGKARQLLEWDKLHQFCGACGNRTIASAHEYSRICINPSCKQIFYPRINPVVIVAVERNNEILLARSPHFPPEIYSMIAGFIEPGESAEEAVKREVMEETGIEIDNVRYFASQSWPRPSELILGFQANYKSGTAIGNPNEIEHADFFHVNSLPKTFAGHITVSQWLLADFCRRHTIL